MTSTSSVHRPSFFPRRLIPPSSTMLKVAAGEAARCTTDPVKRCGQAARLVVCARDSLLSLLMRCRGVRHGSCTGRSRCFASSSRQLSLSLR